MSKHQFIGFNYKSNLSNDEFNKILNDVIAKEEEINVRNFCTCNGNLACLTVKSSFRKAKVVQILATYFPEFKKVGRNKNCECLS